VAIEIRAIEKDRPHETGFAQSVELERIAQPLDHPWGTPPDEREALAWFTHVDPAEINFRFAAWEGDTLVGVGGIGIPLTDNRDKAYMGVTVHLEHRRRGVGSTLTEHLLGVAREHDRTAMVSGLGVPPDGGPDHPSRAFARAVGFASANTEIERQLDLPVDSGLLDRLDAETRPAYAGRYTLELHVDGLPPELLPSFCAAMNRLAVDAPTGTIDFEAESFTPERFTSHLELFLSTGGHRIDTLALTSDREVAAYSAFFLPASDPELAWQGGTLVTAPHRGHRLGTAVKITNLHALQEQFPHVGRVLTQNAESNSYMVSINVALGFRVVAVHEMLLREEV